MCHEVRERNYLYVYPKQPLPSAQRAVDIPDLHACVGPAPRARHPAAFPGPVRPKLWSYERAPSQAESREVLTLS